MLPTAAESATTSKLGTEGKRAASEALLDLYMAARAKERSVRAAQGGERAGRKQRHAPMYSAIAGTEPTSEGPSPR